LNPILFLKISHDFMCFRFSALVWIKNTTQEIQISANNN